MIRCPQETAQWHRWKSWELRVAMSLSRLWQRQGKRKEAQMLTETCNWLTEGFDTPDLREARVLFEELS